MIRLKSLLAEQKTKSVVAAIPNVLFVGDSSLTRSWSYAQRLISNELVDGEVVTEKNPSIDELIELVRSNINDEYNIVSISLFNINKNDLDANQLSITIRKLTDMIEIGKSYGSKVILIPPTDTDTPDKLDIWISKQNIADSVINLPKDDSLRRTNIKLVDKWSNSANGLLDSNANIRVPEKPKDKPSKNTLKDKLKRSGKVKLKNNNKQQDKLNKSNDTETVKSKKSTEVLPKIVTPVGIFSNSVTDQAYSLILPFEGFTAIAKKDSDGYCRIGHGSSHITKEDGTIIDLGKPAAGKSCAETYTYNISEDDAHRDLQRLISDVFIPLVTKKINQWGGDISKFNDATIATLVSVAYNYGHVPEKLKPGIASNDMVAIGNSLKNDFNSSGSNPKRRKKEGDYILNSLNAQPTENEPSLFKQAWNAVKGTLNIGNSGEVKPYVGTLSYTSGFGPRWGKFHYGIDYSLGVGTPIYVAMAGEIVRADGRNVKGYGNVIYVKHDDGVVTRYGHMSRMDVNVGQRVEVGDMIGLTGGAENAPGAGNSTGPHLHWEYIVNGKHVDGLSEAENYFSTHPIKKQDPVTPDELSSMNSRLNNSLWSVNPIDK
jgi:murein DD-endopeptidase MepM/ murein hydrolase activator NlpD